MQGPCKAHENPYYARIRNLQFAVQFSISKQLLSRNMERFREGLVFKAHRILYHSTLGWRVMKKKRRIRVRGFVSKPYVNSLQDPTFRVSGVGLR